MGQAHGNGKAQSPHAVAADGVVGGSVCDSRDGRSWIWRQFSLDHGPESQTSAFRPDSSSELGRVTTRLWGIRSRFSKKNSTGQRLPFEESLVGDGLRQENAPSRRTTGTGSHESERPVEPPPGAPDVSCSWLRTLAQSHKSGVRNEMTQGQEDFLLHRDPSQNYHSVSRLGRGLNHPHPVSLFPWDRPKMWSGPREPSLPTRQADSGTRRPAQTRGPGTLP